MAPTELIFTTALAVILEMLIRAGFAFIVRNLRSRPRE